MAVYAKIVFDFSGGIGPTDISLKLDGIVRNYHRAEGTGIVNSGQNAGYFLDWLNSINTSTNYTISVSSSDGFLSDTISITAKAFGEYWNFGTVTVDGPVVVASKEDSVGTPSTINSNIQNVSCYNAQNGAIFITVEGGTAPYTYQWADGPTSINRENIGAGNYSLTVTDAEGIPSIKSFTVSQPSAIVVNILVDNYNVEALTSGGVPPYTWEWSDGVSGASNYRSGLPTGSYHVQVTDSNGCSKLVSFEVNDAVNGLFFSKNPIPLHLVADDPETKDNLTFQAEVFLEDIWMSDSFRKIGVTQEQPVNDSGATVFTLQDMLDAYLESHLPAYNLASMVRAEKQFKRFYFRYAEKYGDPPEAQPSLDEAVKVVAFGGLSDEEYARNYFVDTYINTKKPFLTWEPDIKTVLKDQPEFLYFMNWFGTENIIVKAEITYTDGSEFATTIFTKNGLELYEIQIIPAGFAQLSIASFQAKEVESYTVWVEDDSSNPITEVRTYVVSNKIYENVRYFLYENALGGFSTLAATGKASVDLNTDSQLVSRILPYDHAPEESNFEVFGTMGQKQIKMPIGNDIHPDYNERIQDFFMSERVYLMQGRYRLVHKIARKVGLSDETENFTEKEFTYELQSFSRYTPEL